MENMKRRSKLFWLALGLLLLAGAGFLLREVIWPGASTFTISKETTFILGPVDQEGYLDYNAALRALAQQGVTVENNAWVLLIQAHGPFEKGTLLDPAYFRELGIKPLPEIGEYYIAPDAFMKKKIVLGKGAKQLSDWVDELNKKPWQAKDAPQVEAWLQANAKPLDLIHQASLRTQAYWPHFLFSGTKQEMARWPARTSVEFTLLHMCKMLSVRSMMHLGEKRFEAAREDLLALMRLSRLIGNSPSFVGFLVAGSMRNLALQGIVIWMQHPDAPLAELERMQQALEALAPFPNGMKTINLSERFRNLNGMLMVKRHGLEYFLLANGGSPNDQFFNTTNWGARGIDWDPILKDANAWLDRWVEAAQKEKLHERLAAMNLIKAEYEQHLSQFEMVSEFFEGISAKGRARLLRKQFLKSMSPAYATYYLKIAEGDQRESLCLVAHGLARFHRTHGRFPEQLSDLAPAFLKAIPSDLFTGQPLIYRKTEAGYLLYSAGPNAKDDAGQGDDVNVKMPTTQP